MVSKEKEESISKQRVTIFQDTSVEDLQAELPEHQPRYVVLSYVRNHDDGRTSYPLCFIYICPTGESAQIKKGF